MESQADDKDLARVSIGSTPKNFRINAQIFIKLGMNIMPPESILLLYI
jgi:hypothetical protein